MKQKRLLFLLVLLTAATGAWAQDDWTNIVINGDLEGTDRQCFFVKENDLGSENVYYASIQEGKGKNGSRGIVLQSTGNEANTWDTQFFLRLPYELPKGTKYKLTFDYKASVDCHCDLQSQNEPTEYIIWRIDDDPNGLRQCDFPTDWDTFESVELTVPYDCDGSAPDGFAKKFQTISFNLSQNHTPTTYYIDNIKLEVHAADLSELTKSPATKVLPQYPVDINSMAIMGDFLGQGDAGNWNTENGWALTQDASNTDLWTLTKTFEAEAKTYSYKLYANGKLSDYTVPVEEDAKGQFEIKEAGEYKLLVAAYTGASVASVIAVPTSGTVTMKAGTEDAANWTIASGQNSAKGDVAGGLTGLSENDPVTLTYGGRLKVKSVTATTDTPIPVVGITLNKIATTIASGETETLSVTCVLPDYATDNTYTWKSSDETKATVDQTGKVTAVAVGSAKIYVEANDGSGVKAECAVTVTGE